MSTRNSVLLTLETCALSQVVEGPVQQRSSFSRTSVVVTDRWRIEPGSREWCQLPALHGGQNY